MAEERATREEFAHLWRTMTPTEIGKRIGVTRQSVYKRAERMGILNERYRPPKDHQTPAWARAAELVEEGLPTPWIAEDTGLNIWAIRRHFRTGHDKGWSRVWPSIRFKPELLKLHREFAPRLHDHLERTV